MNFKIKTIELWDETNIKNKGVIIMNSDKKCVLPADLKLAEYDFFCEACEGETKFLRFTIATDEEKKPHYQCTKCATIFVFQKVSGICQASI